VFQQVLDPVELGVVVGVGGLLPGAGALKGDTAPGQQSAQGLASQIDGPARDGGQVGGEFAQGPVGEGLAQAGRPISLNWWMTSRTVSSSAATSWAMTGTRLPPAEASSIIARR
jgi:hypothetical protein